MYFKQFYLKCLAHASYLIGSEGEAIVVDPQRDIEQYIEEALKNNLKIKYIIETHLHADFVSGHLELAKMTGASIYISKKANAQFEYVPVTDNTKIQLGQIEITFLETPGHTPEGISVLLTDKNKKEASKLLTGDTLFIGEVGRPDLVGSKGFTANQMASMLYDSLWKKILNLDDRTEIYPAHGAGSACGKNISNETSSTLAEQKKNNYALQEMTKDEFIAVVTKDLPKAPDYFLHDVQMNQKGAGLLEDLPSLKSYSPNDVYAMSKETIIFLDVRGVSEFSTAHIAHSINIGLNGAFAPWVGEILNSQKSIIIIAESLEQCQETQLRLARIGYENVIGYIEGGIFGWQKSGLPLQNIVLETVNELNEQIKENNKIQIIDVRKSEEFAKGHIPNAVNIPLNELKNNIDKVDRNKQVIVNCAAGYRGSIAASILKNEGFIEVSNIIGGFGSWASEGLKVIKN